MSDINLEGRAIRINSKEQAIFLREIGVNNGYSVERVIGMDAEAIGLFYVFKNNEVRISKGVDANSVCGGIVDFGCLSSCVEIDIKKIEMNELIKFTRNALHWLPSDAVDELYGFKAN